jgi:hypothetical protein
MIYCVFFSPSQTITHTETSTLSGVGRGEASKV